MSFVLAKYCSPKTSELLVIGLELCNKEDLVTLQKHAHQLSEDHEENA